ncbi:hypothetical protein F8154_12870 [Alkaliphilus pronyensis]|uniref:Uncharacterized protein n=2 Tax=Alkaliphilus pronyensis TaxID=1482732 RepID=A0A6I0F5H1_9FIRM|nr:hypothetical protein F8154_12870 [Alkaliphilus pronyensis]
MSLKVIEKEEISRLRRYIELKYPHSNAKKRAEILGNAILGILDKSLVGFPIQYRPLIKRKLLSQGLFTSQEGIFFNDILEATLSLDVKDDDFFSCVSLWVNCYVSTPINTQTIKEYQYKRSIDDNSSRFVYTNVLDNSTGDGNYDLAKGLPLYMERLLKLKDFKKYRFVFLILSVLIILAIEQQAASEPKADRLPEPPVIEEVVIRKYTHLPENFYYKDIDGFKLKAYLRTRNSILVEEPYFSSIIEVSREFQLNPLILFAIAGHEQGFVPKDHPSATKIANNPFNVFNSWQSYNTDISDSSAIAARTVINLSKDRPQDVDPFKWINRKYAEDKNWWKGVSSIYRRLEAEVQ